MNKKYELLKDDFIEYKGRKLYRIKALKDFGNIKAGDLGGYIENENNLSHKGTCWIYDNAGAYDNAKVFENAQIRNNAEVYDNAQVSGNAIVYDNAEIHEDAQVFGNAIIYDNAEILEDAEVYGNAKIYNDAEIFGRANIYGIAKVYENSSVFGDARVYGYAQIYGDARVFNTAHVHEYAKINKLAKICGNAEIHGSAKINSGNIIGEVSMPYKDIFQYQCENRMLTAILTKNNQILYTIGCQNNLTEQEFLYKIYNENGGLENNPHRKEYLKLIRTINFHFKGE